MLLTEYGISTNTSLLFKTSRTTGEYPNDGIDIVFSSTEEVQLVPSVIFNLYIVPAVHVERLEPSEGCKAIPSNEPL